MSSELQPVPEDWKSPVFAGPLTPGEVQIWCFVLDPGDGVLLARPDGPAEWPSAAAMSMIDGWSFALDPDERQRAQDFRFPRDRRRFVLRHLALRAILSACTGLDPKLIRFAVGPYGKPALSFASAGGAEPGQDVLLQFSTAHSDGQALVALTLGRAVGVDLERMRPEIEASEISRCFFSAREQAQLRKLPPEQILEGFYHTWVCKEAYIKALGQGLSLPLDAFDVTVNPFQPAALLESRPPLPGPERWQMLRLDPGPGFAGALCVEKMAGDDPDNYPAVRLFSSVDIFDWLAGYL